MPTIVVVGGYRLVVYPKDHPPAHVHVYLASGVARVVLGHDVASVDVLTVTGMTRDEAKMALRLVKAHREVLVREWIRFHG